ncbi:MAG: Mu transposase C-terminal domain-containing protein [Clostridia bacterium]|nr:Mu transposase C-terminal domain-containing protein [Clostridia bacterium]
MNMRFLDCTDFTGMHTLEELDAAYEKWLDSDYSHFVNRMTGSSPHQRFMAEYDRLRFADLQKLDIIFLNRETRTLYNNSCIQFGKQLFEVPQEYIASLHGGKRKIQIRYDPEHLSVLYIVDDVQYRILHTLRPSDLAANTRRRRKQLIDYGKAGVE